MIDWGYKKHSPYHMRCDTHCACIFTMEYISYCIVGHAVEKEDKRFICGYEDIKELHE
jgi:hypothetical protein